jgi:hypothetical protein
VINTEDACRETIALLIRRAAGATVCPSEVARALAAQAEDGPAPMDWRDAMPLVHAAVERLVAEGAVQLSWKGEMLTARAGPYRVRRAYERDDGN